MTYVESAGAPPSASAGCIFCDALAAGDDRRALILRRSPHAFLILNKFPYASGHVMVVVTRHVGNIEDATSEELGQAMDMVRVAVRGIRAEYKPDGFNLGANQGRVAGAGIIGHPHLHIVPRWNGDTNFMPVIGDTRVLPETLDTTYDRLHAALGA